jgi:hypothetical protein
MPKDLSPDVTAKWQEVIGQLDRRMLRAIDCHELTILARLLALFDSLSARVDVAPDDVASTRLLLQVVDRVHRLSAAFGLSPADRCRLRIEPEPVENPLDEFRRAFAVGN